MGKVLSVFLLLRMLNIGLMLDYFVNLNDSSSIVHLVPVCVHIDGAYVRWNANVQN